MYPPRPQATRIVAKINKREKIQHDFWCDLGFEISDTTAERVIMSLVSHLQR